MLDDKGIKLLVKRLQSENTKDILFTINQIRNSGDPKIMPYLFDLMIDNPPIEITVAIVKLLNEIKNQGCAIETINALKNDKYKSITKELLTSCWNSGLDYTSNLELFVDLFVCNNFDIAFEAFTIIDTFEGPYNTELIDTLIKKLKNNLSNNDGEKKNLLVELVHKLESMKM
jgi:hypothetical protein